MGSRHQSTEETEESAHLCCAFEVSSPKKKKIIKKRLQQQTVSSHFQSAPIYKLRAPVILRTFGVSSIVSTSLRVVNQHWHLTPAGICKDTGLSFGVASTWSNQNLQRAQHPRLSRSKWASGFLTRYKMSLNHLMNRIYMWKNTNWICWVVNTVIMSFVSATNRFQ